MTFHNSKFGSLKHLITLMTVERMLLSDIEETWKRQADELTSLTDDVTAMETQLQQLLAKLSHLDPASIACVSDSTSSDDDDDDDDSGGGSDNDSDDDDDN